MQVDSAETLTSKTAGDVTAGTEAIVSSIGEKGKEAAQGDGDIEMVDASATRPSLSSRKKTVMSDSVMMFGKMPHSLRIMADVDLRFSRSTARRVGMYGQLRLPD